MTRRLLAALVTTLVTALALVAALLPAQSASAASNATPERKGGGSPGSFTGYAFDTCTAPAQAVMDAWWQESPYAGVGVYIGGSNRLCTQPELTAQWVGAQQQRGWHVMPLWVGPQASCSSYATKMAGDIPTATQQGLAEASVAVAAAQGLGLGAGSTLYYDLEDYDITQTACRQAALGFLSGWTQGLRGAGYTSGVYSNIAAGITSLSFADVASPGSYEMPDEIWFAWDNGRADVETDERVTSTRWDDHARIHQYVLDTAQSFGGYPLNVDVNWADIGKGSTAKTPRPLCSGVEKELKRYPTLKPGKRGTVVEVAQCVLRKQRFLKAKPTGRYDKATIAAVKRAQRKLDLKPTGKLTRPTWAGLLAKGSKPMLKVGDTGTSVTRLQRSLTAALGKRTTVDGVFTQDTEKRVRKLQAKAGLPVTGVVTTDVWDELLGR